MYYELWDHDSGNLAGRYRSERAALRDVAAYVRRHGIQHAEILSLVSDDGRGEGTVIAVGAELTARALAAFPEERERRTAV